MSTRKISAPRPEQPFFGLGGAVAPVWWGWFSRVSRILSGGEPTELPQSRVSTLPPAAEWMGCMVMVTDEIGGYVPAFSDGATWRRVTDRIEVA